jgi:hypothetical protein
MYLLNEFPYMGKDKLWPADKLQGECVVLYLMQPYVNKGQNITTHNFITSVKLAES